MKKLILGLSLLPMLHQAQTLQDAIKKTDGENFESAAADYRALLTKDPTKGDVYFHFGENFIKNDLADSALVYYKKGIEVNPTNPLNYVGAGKVLLMNNKTDDAKAQFYKATSLSANKNAEVFRRIAEAWLTTTNKNADEAIAQLNVAIKLEGKNAENYILMGDAQLEKNPTDGSTPVKSYQTATSMNPKSSKGLLRTGKLYQRARNYPLALDFYRQALGVDANFAPAYREIAEVYMLYNQPAKAIENWKKYLELNNSNDARYRYMSALYQNKQYAEAITEYETLAAANYKNPYLYRLGAYCYEELGDKTDKEAYVKGLKAITTFFSVAGTSFKYLATDYRYQALLLLRNGKDAEGEAALATALSMDAAMGNEIYPKIAKIYADAKNPARTVYFMDKKRKGNFANLSITDAYEVGRAYFKLGEAKAIELNNMKLALQKSKKPLDNSETKVLRQRTDSLMKLSDSAFIRVVTVNPTYMLGYIFRGRSNNYLDTDAGRDTAKVNYEKVISMSKPEEKTGAYKNYVTEAYEYLGYYYVRTKNDAKAKEIFTELKNLDPNNEKAKAYFNPPKPAAAPAAPKK